MVRWMGLGVVRELDCGLVYTVVGWLSDCMCVCLLFGCCTVYACVLVMEACVYRGVVMVDGLKEGWDEILS
jgi:hypothetical protein